MPILISADHRVSVEHPIKFNPLLYKAKSLIYITLPTSTTCPAPQLRSHFIDTYLKSHSWLRSTDSYWSAQRMTIITPFDTWLKFLHIVIFKCGRFQYPASIKGTEKYSIARINSKHWRIFARKGAMQCISHRFDTISCYTIP